MMYNSENTYYTLLYLFIQILLFGTLLSVNQMDFFTGFLWVAEFTVIIVAIILLFYLSVDGYLFKLNLSVSRFLFFFYFVAFVVTLGVVGVYSLPEQDNFISYTNYDCWENYFEALDNANPNDFVAMTVSLYCLNNVELVVVALVLFIGSIVCVQLNKLQKNLKVEQQSSLFKVFSSFKDFVSYTIMRKQDVTNQSNAKPSVRVTRKKNK